jgi:hypothetical protein
MKTIIDEIEALYSFVDLQLEGLENYFNTIKSFMEPPIEICNEHEVIHETDNKTIERLLFHLPLFFENHFHDSFVVILISYFERLSRNICSFISERKNLSLKEGDLAGGIVGKFKKYIVNLGGFDIENKELWSELEDIYEIRCVIVHGCGVIKHSKRSSKRRIKTLQTKKLIEIYELIDEDKENEEKAYINTDFRDIVVGPEFCEYALVTIRKFFHSLGHAHMKKYKNLYTIK